VITPRRTRLLRVPDLKSFRGVIRAWCAELPGEDVLDHLVVVPTRAAAAQLEGQAGMGGPSRFVTRDELYERLLARLERPPRRVDVFERDALAQAAASEAAAAVPGLPFRLRSGLITEILRFYDQLRRQSQRPARFEELLEQALGGDAAAADRGTARLLQQTRFLGRAFAEYERRLGAANACDEHVLRHRLLAEAGRPPLRRVLVTAADWVADPDGLFVADYDLLARLPQLEALDVLGTEGVLASGFRQRVRDWLPDIDEVDAASLYGIAPRPAPVLLVPADAPADRPWFTCRDREEELIAVARRAAAPGAASADRTAVVFKRPLPYLYLAPAAFVAAGLRYTAADGLPLAAEPAAAALDLVLDVVRTRASRAALVALLRSPHFTLGDPRPPRDAVAALDRALSAARYLGGPAHLDALAADASFAPEARPALDAAVACVRELALLGDEAPASRQIRHLAAFAAARWRSLDSEGPFGARERRARAALSDLLERLAAAHAAHHDPPWSIDELSAAVRRWIEEQTFAPEPAAGRLHLLDDRTARYGEFEEMALVGLVEHEWPERPRRNIFYPASLIQALGWPSELDRRAAADAQFIDLLASAGRRVTLSAPTLDDESLVLRSTQLDRVASVGLLPVPETADLSGSLLVDEALAAAPPLPLLPDERVRGWAELRLGRPPADLAEFHGEVGPQAARAWSVSALETYLACPFKFFAQHVLRLEEEPEDEEVMDPRRQGQFVHEVFESFFDTWQRAGRRTISPDTLGEARETFATIVERALERLPEGEAALERTRLLGSAAAAGLGDAVLRMEAERPVAVAERLLEHRLEGEFLIATAAGPRVVPLRGKADRLDLLEDGTFRVIDYKLGWPPDRNRALQLPIYGLCAEQRLAGYRGRAWTFGEGVYLAFKGPRRVVPLFGSSGQRTEALVSAQQRLADTLDAIGRGNFPPSPDDVFRCETCRYASVCRKDYV
jgi:RecB family exonuclease